MPGKVFRQKSYFVFISITFLVILTLSANSQITSTESVLDKLNSTENGVFTGGELAYVADGKDLGSETYELAKTENGEIVLTSSGVVTPPIPIPFVNPKIKFDQKITVGSDLTPQSLKLDYDGPLGIGSDRIRATVQDDRIVADLGGDEREADLKAKYSFFQGTGGSQSLTALILFSKDGLGEIAEIRTGGTGPQSGDEDRLKVDLELKRVESQELMINGNPEEVQRYILNDPVSTVDKIILANDGTFIAYLRIGGENPFYVYRTDLLGEDYKF